MDFLDPKKRRSYNIRLFIGFILISIAIVLATTILALITAGYTINRKTGQVIQNSLVFINSQPVSASIYINGSLSGTTNARFVLGSGNYDVKLQQAGYHTWSNHIALYGGQVEQLTYPFLFPNTPLKSTISTLSSAPSVFSYTPDRHWLLVSVPGQVGSFYVIDLTNTKTPITQITIPADVLGSKPGTNNLTAVQWSTDNLHLLLRDDYQGGSQYIMLNRTDPTTSFNLEQLFSSATFTSVKMDNQAYDKLYLYDQTSLSLSLADVTAKTVTPVLSSVLAFSPYSTNQILYTTPDAKQSNMVDAELYNSDVNKSYTLRELPTGTSYELNMASYNSSLYAVVGSSGSNYAYVYMNPLDQFSAQPNTQPLPYTLIVVNGSPENVTFSNNARFIALQSGSQFGVYDIQYDTHYRYDTTLALAPNQLALWMDGNRLEANINGKLTIWDFDGTNMVSLTPASTANDSAFNQNYSAVYTAVPVATPGSTAVDVVRNSLIANKP